MARNLERRYLELGGEISYDARVARILTQRTGGGRPRGRASSSPTGSQEPAEVVISAADGHATIYEMLGGAYLDDQLRDVYERDELPLFYPILFVGVGVARDFAGRAPAHLRTAPRPPRAHRRRRRPGTEVLEVRISNFDPIARPGGQDRPHLGDRGGRPVLDRAARARPGAVQGREGAHRRRRRARPGPPLPRPRASRSRWWTWPPLRRPSATPATGAPASRASCPRRAT